MTQKLRIFGAGVGGAVAADLVAWQFADRFEIEGFYDDRMATIGRGPGNLPILGSVADGLDALPGSGRAALVRLGTRGSAAGWRTFLSLRDRGVSLPSLVSPDAHVAPSARIGRNVMVFPGVFIGTFTSIGDMTTLHGGCAIEHHGALGDNVLVGPGVAAAGGVSIGSHSLIGTGARLASGSRVGIGAILGAGALLTRDIPPHTVAFGSPAVCIRPVRPGDDVPSEAEIAAFAALPGTGAAGSRA
jgi:sugar O-acyltransferase (sialic acid O-acetyltransferase NeuD family)